METNKTLTNKTSEEVTMELDLKASASEEETLTDHYVILKTLGKGTFAEVKLAYHLHTEVQVAIKVLQNGTKNDLNIETEIDLLKMLNHPNIIKLFHVINTKEYTYMVMEHAARGDLVSHVERVGRMQEEQSQDMFAQLVCAVDYCHENGIAHRDIKLDNILLDGKGNIKLCDFGLATRVIPGQGTKGLCGTLEYCAPELFFEAEYDARAVDIWSMGVVLYAMVTASFPFKSKTYTEMKEEMLDPKYQLPYSLSETLADIVMQLFTVKPEQRPKISDIRQHQWLKPKEEFRKITSSLEAVSNNPDPSVVVAMLNMGYDPKDISACLQEKKFNNIMATYLILNHKSHLDHSKYARKCLPACVITTPADALSTVPFQKGQSELALSTMMEEHQVLFEEGSRKKQMRSLSMPATLCGHQKENKCLPPAPKFTRKIMHIKSRKLPEDRMSSKSSSSTSLTSESIFSGNGFSCESPHELNTTNNGTHNLSTPSVRSYREVPHSVKITVTYDFHRSSHLATSKITFGDFPPEGINEIQRSFLQQTIKKSFDDIPQEGIPEIQKSSLQEMSKNTFDNVSCEDVIDIQEASVQTTSRYSLDHVSFENLNEVQRPSLQTTSKNSCDNIPTEGITVTSASHLSSSASHLSTSSASWLSRGWKRVKKRTEIFLRLLHCCLPASKRSHVSQKEVKTEEVESGTVTHTQLHGVPKMHACVS